MQRLHHMPIEGDSASPNELNFVAFRTFRQRASNPYSSDCVELFILGTTENAHTVWYEDQIEETQAFCGKQQPQPEGGGTEASHHIPSPPTGRSVEAIQRRDGRRSTLSVREGEAGRVYPPSAS